LLRSESCESLAKGGFRLAKRIARALAKRIARAHCVERWLRKMSEVWHLALLGLRGEPSKIRGLLRLLKWRWLESSPIKGCRWRAEGHHILSLCLLRLAEDRGSLRLLRATERELLRLGHCRLISSTEVQGGLAPSVVAAICCEEVIGWLW